VRDLQTRRCAGFVGMTLALGIVWLVILPAIGRQADVAAHISSQKQMGIDPSAMFYTELEIAPAVTDHVERLRVSNPDQFWKQ